MVEIEVIGHGVKMCGVLVLVALVFAKEWVCIKKEDESKIKKKD